MVSEILPRSRQAWSCTLGVLAAAIATTAAAWVLEQTLWSDVFVAAWALGGALVALVGAAAAWMGRRALLWVTSLLLAALSVVGMLSIGFLFAPAACCLLGAALLSGWAGSLLPRPGATAVASTGEGVVAWTVTAFASIAGGWALVDAGALSRELFGACATESPECVIARAHWDAVGVTGLGLVAITVGGWLLWRQAAAIWLLSATAESR